MQDNVQALARTYAVEKPFEFIDRESGAMITGVVDLLERAEPGPGGDVQRQAVGIVDFKAHRVSSVEAFDNLRHHAERQLRLYANAVRYAFPYEPAVATAQLVTPSPPSAELQAEGVTERITIDVSSQSQRAALEEVRVAVGGIKESLGAQRFERCGPQSGYCQRCDFRTFCPGFREWRELDQSSPPPPTPVEEREAEVDHIVEEQGAGP